MELAVISGKGGTGKSSLSAAFATLNENVIIADCDVDAANLYLLFCPSIEEEEIFISGHKAIVNYKNCTDCLLCMSYCRFEAISMENDRIKISEILCDGCFLCSRICPEKAIDMIPNDKSRLYSGSFRNGKMVYGRLAPGEENSGKLVNMVRRRAKKIQKEGRIEHIILDGPPGIGCPVISTITGADKVVIITEPTVSGLSDLIRASDLTVKSGRKPAVIINKWDLNPSMTRQINSWCCENGIGVIDEIPFDPIFVEAMINAKSVIEYDPDNQISRIIKSIWYKLLNEKQYE